MKLYDGGAIILVLLMLTAVGWAYQTEKLEKQIEECDTQTIVVEEPAPEKCDPARWFWRGC